MAQAIAARPEVACLYREFSPVNHLSIDDPPLLLDYGRPLEDQQEGIHHSLFGLKFQERAHALGLTTCSFSVRKDDRYPGYPGGVDKFIETVLGP